MQLSQFHAHFLVGNKAKGRISKRVFQENKARQIFRKTNILYPLIRTRTSFQRFILVGKGIYCLSVGCRAHFSENN